ncbi:MAG: hypothetical protein Q4B30_07675, partial [Coriobacteriaceae bacterium]|nr:hypothetical protein [Coriobacteriaceae bacterium]
SQRIDATSTLPAVKEIVFLAVTYVLLHWLIVNSLDIMQSIYSIAVDKIIPQIGSAGTTSSVFGVELSTEPITNEVWDKLSIGGCFMTAITALLSLGGAAIAYLFAFVVAYARAWQVYAMAAFSAIPLALLGFDETRQMGIGFLKNFAAAVLAGAIMMFLFVIYPTAITALNLGSLEGMDIPLLFLMVADGGGTFAIALPMVLSMLEFAGCTVLLVLALGKTGAWAKEILGS